MRFACDFHILSLIGVPAKIGHSVERPGFPRLRQMDTDGIKLKR